MSTFLWVIFPYLCLATFALGHVWRYRYDKFGWTTRSSQLYENRLLRLGSPLFHFGMLGVVGGHVVGLLVPRSWTAAVGIDDHLYHLVAIVGGLTAGLMTLVGMANSISACARRASCSVRAWMPGPRSAGSRAAWSSG